MVLNIIIPTCPGNEKQLERCLISVLLGTEIEYKLTIVKNNRIGFAKAINLALKDADDDVILLNDDCIVIHGWVEEFINKKKEADIIGQAGTIREEHLPFWAVYIKKEVIEKIGMLDERFLIGEWEDVDYCIRAIDADFKIGATNRNLIIHETHGTIKKLTEEEIKLKDQNKQKFLDKWKGTKWEKRLNGNEW